MTDHTDYLVEDEDGAPYPHCERCPDQIAPHLGGDWAHVYENEQTGHRTFLWNCQRPHEGRYGTAENRATPPEHLRGGGERR